ncbi:MAG: hypothetical protein ACFFD4_25510 [Candidatus Odinarchaeota archaeon]
MKIELSNNEEIVLRSFFSMRNYSETSCRWEEPSVGNLVDSLQGKLVNKQGDILTDPPDPRYVSKLKSTGFDKISTTLESLAQSMRLDYNSFDSYKQKSEKYHRKSLGIIKGFNFLLNTYVYLIYTFWDTDREENSRDRPSSGAIAWYVHDYTSCEKCLPGKECHVVLEQIIRERFLEVPPEIRDADFDKKVNWVLKALNEEWNDGCNQDES